MDVKIEGAKLVSVAFKNGEHPLVTVKFNPASDITRTVEVGIERAPHSELIAARASVAGFVPRLCEIPTKASAPVELRGVAFKYNEDDNPGAVLKGFRPYANSEKGLVLNTPIKYDKDSGPNRMMDSDLATALERLKDEIINFLQGAKDQGDMFEAPQETDEEFDDGGAQLEAVAANQ